jgi:hypothetical protein
MKKVLKTLALMGINVVLAVSSLSPCAMTAEAAEFSTEISEEVIVSDENATDEEVEEADFEEALPEEELILEEPYEDGEEEIVLEEEPSEETVEEAEEADFTADNKCGESATWSFDSKKGALAIKGTGAIKDYTEEQSAPWHSYNAKIKTITIGSGITRIGNYAFDHAGYNESATGGVLTSITISDTVTEIGDYAFCACAFDSKNIHDFTIPDTVTTLGKGSFSYFDLGVSYPMAEKYESGTFTIGKGIKTIPESCFEWTEAAHVVISEGVERIEKKGMYCFYALFDIEFPSTLKYVDEYGCGCWTDYHTFMRNITFKGDMPQFAEKAFDNRISYIIYPAGNSTYTEKTIANAKKAFKASTWRPSDYVITYKAGEDITWSEKKVKSGNSERLILELKGTGPMYDYSLDNLPDWFPNRFFVDAIKIDSRITSIGNYAFFDFESVNNSGDYPLVLPDKLDRIGDHAFENLDVIRMSMPKEVSYIGDYAFYFCRPYYSSKEDLPKGVKYLGDYCLPSNTEFTVDLEGVEHIGEGALSGKSKTIKSAVIPDSVKYIGAGAFSGNTSLSGELVIPDTVTFVGERAFYGCSNLTGATKLMGVTSIESKVFDESGITEVTYGSKVTSANVDPKYRFSDTITKVTFNHRYFEGMEDVFRSLSRGNQKITVCYPGGKGWPQDLAYKNLNFVAFGDCEVTFVYPDGHKTVKKIATGKKLTAPTDVKLADGVSLVGWFTEDKVVKSLQWDFNNPVAKEMTLYAKTTEYECYVQFVMPMTLGYPNGYTNGCGYQLVKYGEKAKAIHVGCKGGRLRGWYADQALTTPFDFDEPITEDITIYSKWDIVDVVDFNKDANRVSYEKDLYMEFVGVKTRLSPVIRVKYDDGYDTLQELVDFRVEAVDYNTGNNFRDVGDYTLKVKGSGSNGWNSNYTGEIIVTQHITPLDLATTDKIKSRELSCVYNGSVQKLKPVLTLALDAGYLGVLEGRDYTVEYVDEDKPGYFKEPGEYQIRITGKGNYMGEMILTQTIREKKPAPDPKPEPTPDPEPEPVPVPVGKVKSITKAKVTGLQNFVFDGYAHNNQKLIVKDGDKVLQEDVHYTLEWSNYTFPGTGRVVVKGIKAGGYKGKKTLTFKIAKADINDRMIVEVPETVTYTKGKTTPEVKVYYKTADGEKFLLEGNEYFKISYKNNTKVNDGTGKKVPTVVVTGKKYFKGTVKKIFKIAPSSITNCKASAKDIKYKKGKGNFKSKVVVTDSNGKKLTAGKDYDAKNMVFTVESTGKVLGKKDSVDLDTTIVVKIRGLGNYASSEEISCTYKVTK